MKPSSVAVWIRYKHSCFPTRWENMSCELALFKHDLTLHLPPLQSTFFNKRENKRSTYSSIAPFDLGHTTFADRPTRSIYKKKFHPNSQNVLFYCIRDHPCYSFWLDRNSHMLGFDLVLFPYFSNSQMLHTVNQNKMEETYGWKYPKNKKNFNFNKELHTVNDSHINEIDETTALP